MKQFIVLYFIFVGILFSLLVLPTTDFYFFLNHFQTELILFLLDIFLEDKQRIGRDIWIHESYKIIITVTCNGLIPIVFLLASLWAYPASLWHKTLWTFLGYIILVIVNVVRIIWVVFVTQNGEGQEDFYWSHDVVGNGLLMISGLALFITFIKTNPKRFTHY